MSKITRRRITLIVVLFLSIVGCLLALSINYNIRRSHDTYIKGPTRMALIVNVPQYEGGPCSFYAFDKDGNNTLQCIRIDIDTALLQAGFTGTYQERYDQNIEFLKVDVEATTSKQRLTGSTARPIYEDYTVYEVTKIYTAEIYKP